MNKDLKIGDVIEVYKAQYNKWVDRIFIKHGINNSVIHVDESSTEDFKDGIAFDTSLADSWRIKKVPEFIAFSDDELISKLPFAVKPIGCSDVITVSHYSNSQFRFITNSYVHTAYNAQQLLKDYTFVDGSPIGKIKEC